MLIDRGAEPLAVDRRTVGVEAREHVLDQAWLVSGCCVNEA